MRQQATIGDRIIELVRARPDCTLGEVMQQLPDLDWAVVYLEVKRLRRLGHLRQIQKSFLGCRTTLRLP